MPQDFVYNVTYPDPNIDYKIQDDGIDLISLIDEERRPVVVLFGWVGSEDKYLSVYSKIYEAKGLSTLRWIVPTKTMFLKRSRMPAIGREILRVLSDEMKIDRKMPLIVHCFSNGGSFIYQFFLEALKKSLHPFRVEGVIFDSAPAKRRLMVVYRALKPIIGGNVVVNFLIIIFILIGVIALWTWEYIRIKILRKEVIQFKPWRNLLYDENQCPQHFIYSKSDEIVPYQDIENFIESRKSLGIRVTTKCYEETSHVKHYPENKLSYTRSIFDFMCECLNPNII